MEFKGKKYYGILNPNHSNPNLINIDSDIDIVKKLMDNNYKILVEIEVTRVFTISDIVEIEN